MSKIKDFINSKMTIPTESYTIQYADFLEYCNRGISKVNDLYQVSLDSLDTDTLSDNEFNKPINGLSKTEAMIAVLAFLYPNSLVNIVGTPEDDPETEVLLKDPEEQFSSNGIFFSSDDMVDDTKNMRTLRTPLLLLDYDDSDLDNPSTLDYLSQFSGDVRVYEKILWENVGFVYSNFDISSFVNKMVFDEEVNTKEVVFITATKNEEIPRKDKKILEDITRSLLKEKGIEYNPSLFSEYCVDVSKLKTYSNFMKLFEVSNEAQIIQAFGSSFLKLYDEIIAELTDNDTKPLLKVLYVPKLGLGEGIKLFLYVVAYLMLNDGIRVYSTNNVYSILNALCDMNSGKSYPASVRLSIENYLYANAHNNSKEIAKSFLVVRGRESDKSSLAPAILDSVDVEGSVVMYDADNLVKSLIKIFRTTVDQNGIVRNTSILDKVEVNEAKVRNPELISGLDIFSLEDKIVSMYSSSKLLPDLDLISNFKSIRRVNLSDTMQEEEGKLSILQNNSIKIWEALLNFFSKSIYRLPKFSDRTRYITMRDIFFVETGKNLKVCVYLQDTTYKLRYDCNNCLIDLSLKNYLPYCSTRNFSRFSNSEQSDSNYDCKKMVLELKELLKRSEPNMKFSSPKSEYVPGTIGINVFLSDVAALLLRDSSNPSQSDFEPIDLKLASLFLSDLCNLVRINATMTNMFLFCKGSDRPSLFKLEMANPLNIKMYNNLDRFAEIIAPETSEIVSPTINLFGGPILTSLISDQRTDYVPLNGYNFRVNVLHSLKKEI